MYDHTHDGLSSVVGRSEAQNEPCAKRVGSIPTGGMIFPRPAPASRQPLASLSPASRLAFAWQSDTRHTVSSLIARHADEKGARECLWVSHGLGDMLC